MDEQKRQERHSAMEKGAYSMTPALFNTLNKGDVIVFSEHSGNEEHTAVILCGRGIDIIEEQTKRIKELETAKTIGIQACDLLKERNEELETLLGQLIEIAEKADTDDSEDTTIELAKQALKPRT